MKKSRNRTKKAKDELRPEYKFDYRKAKPNRFAAKVKKGSALSSWILSWRRFFRTPRESIRCCVRLLRQCPADRRGAEGLVKRPCADRHALSWRAGMPGLQSRAGYHTRDAMTYG